MSGGFTMVFGWLAILVVIVFSAKVFLGDSWGHKLLNRSEHGKTALDILQERYAQGEISESEYLVMKANLLK
jgi:uncharacterized membrane protein